MSLRTCAAALCATLLLGAGLGGCGPSSNSSPLVGGVAATSSALANAAITLTDANGTSRTTTSDASGRYTFDVAGLVAPFVIVASGDFGDGTETLVSVAPTSPAYGSRATVHTTPLTTALAAALDSNGDPLHLAANMATESSNITTAALNKVQTNLQGSLGNVLTALGLQGNTDFVGGTLVADGTGMDQLLDSVQVNVAPGGTAGGGTTLAVKDGNGTVTTANLNLAAGSASGLALTTPASYLILDRIQSAITACFTGTASSTRSISAACTGLFTSDYLNNGFNAAQELAPFNNAAFDNATAESPQLVYYTDDSHAVIKLVLDLTDGSRYAFTTLAERSASTGNLWKLRGNQRHFHTFVNGMTQWVNQLNASAAVPSAYTSGINLYFNATAGSAATVFANANSYVLVTGPGLPAAGVVLKTSLGSCPFLTITSESGNTAAGHRNSCASYFRMTGKAVNSVQQAAFVNVFTGPITGGGTPSPQHAPQYADGIVSDTTLQAITPFSRYTVKIHDGLTNRDIATYTEYLRSRPLTTAALPNVRWTHLSTTTRGLLAPSSTTAFAGGNAMPLSWTPQTYAPRVGAVEVQIRAAGTLVAANPRVPPSVNSYTVHSATAFPAVTGMNSTPSNGDFDWVGLIARNRHDLQIESVNQYSMN